MNAVVKFGERFDIGSDIGVFLADTLLRPSDICVYRRGVAGGFLVGADLLRAIEIAASSLDDDLENKADDYARHGIADFWSVDLAARKLHIHRDPAPDGYRDVGAQGWDAPATPICAPDVTLDLAHILRWLT